MDASRTPDLQAVRAEVRAALSHAGGLCVLTGAGMSAESGIATFRDALTGVWSTFDPQELASVEGFRADPARVWAWYAERREAVRTAAPNAGHRALGDAHRRYPGSLVVVTQNVDDLHQRGGALGTVRLHGDLLADQWLDPCARRPACLPASARPGRPPTCADCGNRVRPGVVWFGEMLPPAAIGAAESAVRRCRLLVVVGTSGAVWPAAGLAAQARGHGARVVIVNPAASDIDDEADVLLRGTAAGLLPALLASA